MYSFIFWFNVVFLVGIYLDAIFEEWLDAAGHYYLQKNGWFYIFEILAVYPLLIIITCLITKKFPKRYLLHFLIFLLLSPLVTMFLAIVFQQIFYFLI